MIQILIIDDEKAIRKTLSEILSFEGYKIDEASDGEEGLKKFTEETVLYYTNNFYENSNATATNIGTISNLENINHFSMEQAVKLFEELLKIEREKYNKENSKNDK